MLLVPLTINANIYYKKLIFSVKKYTKEVPVEGNLKTTISYSMSFYKRKATNARANR